MSSQDSREPKLTALDVLRSPLPAEIAVPGETPTPPGGLTAAPRVWPPRSAGALTIAWDYGDPACIWLG